MSEKTKILFAIDTLAIGGAPSVVYYQSKFMDPAKFDVFVMMLYTTKKESFIEKMDFLPAEKIRQFDLKERSPFDLKTWYKIFSFLKAEKFDVVYTHLFLTNLIVRAMAVLARVPKIMAFEHSRYFNKRSWQIMADKLLSFFTFKIIVSNNSIADFTSAQEKIKRNKFAVIANPVVIPSRNEVDVGYWKKRLDLHENDFAVLTLGRFSEEKGVTYLLQAVEIIGRQIDNLRVLIAGYGYYEDKIREEIQNRGLGGICRIVKEPQRAQELYYLGNVFVMPSTREGQSIVTYEALRAGLSVVASSLDSIQEIIVDGENGLLIKPADPLALAKAITYLYAHPDLREKFRIAGPASVAMFTPAKTAKELEKIIIAMD
jgi:glycosyltransferase involved in cell wall biosynthesis